VAMSFHVANQKRRWIFCWNQL